MTVKIIHDKNACIGCGACVAVCPAHWEMGSDGKSLLKGAKPGVGGEVLEAKEQGCNMLAAQSCPVNCIHIDDNGKKII